MSELRRRLAFYDELGGAPFAEIAAQKGAASGLATLDEQAKLSPAVNPSRQPFIGSMLDFIKGERVGTAGATPIALRCDDWQIDINDVWAAEFYSRGFSPSIALCTALTEPWQAGTHVGNIDYSGRTPISWDILRDWNYNKGFEFWAHGRTHQPPHTAVNGVVSYHKLVNEIVGPLADFEANNIRGIGWTKPGVSIPGYGSYLVSPADWLTDAGRLLQDNWPLTETDLTGTFRHVPSKARHGLAHTTMTDGMTQVEAIRLIDAAVTGKRGLQIMMHCGNIGAVGNMTATEIRVVLDYLKTLWDAGTIEMLTPSSLAYADPTSTYRLDLIGNGDFEKAVPTGEQGTYNWGAINGTTSSIVTVGDAHSGTKVLRLTGTGQPFQIEEQMAQRMTAGQTYRFEGWCRALTAGGASTANAEVIVQDIQNTARWTVDRLFPVTTSWTRVRFPFTPPPDTVKMATKLGRSVAGGGVSTQVEWDDVHVYVA